MKAFIKNKAAEKHISAQLVMQNYRLERKATLWWALERTTQKRDSGMILTDYPEIMKEIRESDTLRKLWEKHSREFEYAKDISFDDTCNTIQTVMALTRRYAAIVTMRRRHRHHETSGQLRGAELRRADRSLRQPGHDGCLHLHQQGRQTRGCGRRARDVLSARAAFPRQRRPSVVYRNPGIGDPKRMASKCRGLFPRPFSYLQGVSLRGPSRSVDESGSDNLRDKYYLLALVLYEQSDPITHESERYE